MYQHIEALTKAQRPRRSKSFSRSMDKIAVPRTSTSSPFGGESTAAPAKGRVSSDSQKSTVVGSGESRRTSLEKVKGAKIFHARTLSDKHEPANAGLARSQNENGINREYPEFEASPPPAFPSQPCLFLTSLPAWLPAGGRGAPARVRRAHALWRNDEGVAHP